MSCPAAQRRAKASPTAPSSARDPRVGFGQSGRSSPGRSRTAAAECLSGRAWRPPIRGLPAGPSSPNRDCTKVPSSLSPHAAHAGADIDAHASACWPYGRFWRRHRPCRSLKKAEQSIGNETRSRSVDMPVALRVLAMGEETLRHNEVKIVLGARHRDIEQTPLLLDLGGRPSAEVGGNAAIDDVEHEDGLPFLALGGMDRRKDQIVLVEQRHAGLVARRVRRIERKFGQETLPGRITVCDLLELDQIGVRGAGILVDAVEMRFIPEARPLQFRRPPRSARVQIAHCFDEGGPDSAGSWRRWRAGKRADRIGWIWYAGPDPAASRSGRPRASAASPGNRRRGRADSRRSAAEPAYP